MPNSAIKDRIVRMRSGGIDGPSPTGLLLSVASGSGNAMLVVHDLGLSVGEPVTVIADGKTVRLSHGGRIVLQTPDTTESLLPSLIRAPLIEVLETEGGEPLRLHAAKLGR